MMENEQLYYSIADQLGLSSSDVLFIASDVKKMALDSKSKGYSFDVNLFIDSFQKTLSTGTIIIPAYTDYLKNNGVFSQQKSKPSTGALSNRVMRRKDFNRSIDPLHSVFSWGENSDRIAEIGSNSSLGKGSIFEFLLQEKAKMICIDVDFQESLTFVHYVEELLKVNYRKAYNWNFKLELIGKDAFEKEVVFYTKKSWILTDLAELQKESIKSGVVKEIIIGKSRILSFDIETMDDFIQEYISSGKKLYRVSLKEWMRNSARKILQKK